MDPKALGPSEAMMRLRSRFPARPVPLDWPGTRRPRDESLHRLKEDSGYTTDTVRGVVRGVVGLLEWLEGWPGDTWQSRWLASGVQAHSGAGWRATRVPAVMRGLSEHKTNDLTADIRALICIDVLRPDVHWMVSRKWLGLIDALYWRDPEGITELKARAAAHSDLRKVAVSEALGRIAVILACKGGGVAEITVGDCVELAEAQDKARGPRAGTNKSLFYLLLHSMGIFPEDAPATVRVFGRARGQLSVEQLVDRYDLACCPVRNVLVDYLRERQPQLDYNSLSQLSLILCKSFWADLEAHHPGIDSLRLEPAVAVAWKERMRTKVRRLRQADGSVSEVRSPRLAAVEDMARVRAFYLDITQWAVDDPARWAAWAVPCPISEAEANFGKEVRRRKARMDQRTRERLPVLPRLVAAVDAERMLAAARLAAARAASPGTAFSVSDERWHRPQLPHAHATWADDGQGVRRNLDVEESNAFWTWATVEVLRHTGVRIEEMLELSHHGIVQYRLPSTGELVPLLQIAPSKTDEERLLLVTPELADVLSQIVRRVRDTPGPCPGCRPTTPTRRCGCRPCRGSFNTHEAARGAV
ncbi:hypothetical protein [Streptomyces lydicus]|uniref:hypothetical protein n=1 Tax=Streptomyces lydicus TaxID=47763 RepID=UPI0036E5B167